MIRARLEDSIEQGGNRNATTAHDMEQSNEALKEQNELLQRTVAEHLETKFQSHFFQKEKEKEKRDTEASNGPKPRYAELLHCYCTFFLLGCSPGRCAPIQPSRAVGAAEVSDHQ